MRFLSTRLFISQILLCAAGFLAPSTSGHAQNQVYVSRFWHNHQPIYWPEWNGNGAQTSRVQYAWDSIVLKNTQTYGTGTGHPDNNLSDTFGLDESPCRLSGKAARLTS